MDCFFVAWMVFWSLVGFMIFSYKEKKTESVCAKSVISIEEIGFELGDKVVILSERFLSREQMQNIKIAWADSVDSGVIVLDAGLTLKILKNKESK